MGHNNILDRIVETKREEIKIQSSKEPEKLLMAKRYFKRESYSLKERLIESDSSGIIAEFKRRSPSRGDINSKISVEQVTGDYVKAGAVALSVLTDESYFGGSLADLESARDNNPNTPILRKDFIIDPFQITQAKAYGADIILLIAAVLTGKLLEKLAQKAKSIGLEVLLEIHDISELEKINRFIDIVGVNNRDLKTFKTDIQNSVVLSKHLPADIPKISESGISSAETVNYLREYGFRGFLIGEYFMRSTNPGKECNIFINSLKNL